MKNKRFLIASTGISPYLTEPAYTELVFLLAKAIHSRGGQVRMFMPKFGIINERKMQLHEVIRLSGTNIVVDDEDIPLIIKVASIPKERMQVYFIDSSESFHQKMLFTDENGEIRSDLTDFMLFFTKSVVETAKKLNWNADYVINVGWFTAFLPLYLKTYYKDEPLLHDAQLMHILVNDMALPGPLPGDVKRKLDFDELEEAEYAPYLPPETVNLFKGASHYADILMNGEDDLQPELKKIYDDFHRFKGKISVSLLQENSRIFDEILEQFQSLS